VIIHTKLSLFWRLTAFKKHINSYTTLIHKLLRLTWHEFSLLIPFNLRCEFLLKVVFFDLSSSSLIEELQFQDSESGTRMILNLLITTHTFSTKCERKSKEIHRGHLVEHLTTHKSITQRKSKWYSKSLPLYYIRSRTTSIGSNITYLFSTYNYVRILTKTNWIVFDSFSI